MIKDRPNPTESRRRYEDHEWLPGGSAALLRVCVSLVNQTEQTRVAKKGKRARGKVRFESVDAHSAEVVQYFGNLALGRGTVLCSVRSACTSRKPWHTNHRLLTVSVNAEEASCASREMTTSSPPKPRQNRVLPKGRCAREISNQCSKDAPSLAHQSRVK